jgi:hypothetical protein
VKRGAQRELPTTGIGADHELDHEASRAIRVFDAEIGEACVPGLLGHGMVSVTERAVPEIFAHDFLLTRKTGTKRRLAPSRKDAKELFKSSF